MGLTESLCWCSFFVVILSRRRRTPAFSLPQMRTCYLCVKVFAFLFVIPAGRVPRECFLLAGVGANLLLLLSLLSLLLLLLLLK